MAISKEERLARSRARYHKNTENPEFVEKMRERSRKRESDPEVKKKRQTYNKKRSEDPEVVEKKRAYDRERLSTPEMKLKRKEYAKAYNAEIVTTPEYREKRREYNLNRADREENLKRRSEYQKQRLLNDPEYRERTRAYNNARQQEYFKDEDNREARRKYKEEYLSDPVNAARQKEGYKKHAATDKCRDTYLKRTFGITLEDYNRMIEEQGGGCAICGATGSKKNGEKQSLSVDHNHDNDKVRGVLCHKCNVGLGHFLDDIDLLTKATEYLKKHI